MDRPDLRTMTRPDAARYIVHLEKVIAGLRADADAIQPGKPYGDGIGPFARDSATSRKAAVANYPKKGSQREKCLIAIIESGWHGMTRQEVGKKVGLPPNVATPRVKELLEGGWVKEDADRFRKTDSGQDAAILVMTDKGHRAYLRSLEGLPAVPPVKRDGSPAGPPAHMLPDESLFDQEGAVGGS